MKKSDKIKLKVPDITWIEFGGRITSLAYEQMLETGMGIIAFGLPDVSKKDVPRLFVPDDKPVPSEEIIKHLRKPPPVKAEKIIELRECLIRGWLEKVANKINGRAGKVIAAVEEAGDKRNLEVVVKEPKRFRQLYPKISITGMNSPDSPER